jgi:hypothetical protein
LISLSVSAAHPFDLPLWMQGAHDAATQDCNLGRLAFGRLYDDARPGHRRGTLAAGGGALTLHFSETGSADTPRVREIRIAHNAREDLPQFDIVALHGIYSWVADEHRRTIVRFLDKRVKPGGLVYVSYNALPGRANAAPMRHLMALHGRQTGGPTAGRLEPALEFIGRVAEAKATHFAAQSDFADRLAKLRKLQANYLAHEYLNDAWRSSIIRMLPASLLKHGFLLRRRQTCSTMWTG